MPLVISEWVKGIVLLSIFISYILGSVLKNETLKYQEFSGTLFPIFNPSVLEKLTTSEARLILYTNFYKKEVKKSLALQFRFFSCPHLIWERANISK